MSFERLPNPNRYTDWKTWAKDLIKEVEAPANSQRPSPTILLLQHMMGWESAAVDGLLMFDPELGVPVYSHGGAWHPLSTP